MQSKLVIGYFGFFSNKLDGQTVKTRSFYDLLKQVDGNVKFFDTESAQINKLNLIKLLWLICISKRIYYFPAHNSLRFFFPFLYWVSAIFNKKLYYFMIGGWLTEFLKANTNIKCKIGKIDKIFCETYTIKHELFEEFGFTNLDYFPNFRDAPFEPAFNMVDSNHVKMVYVGRINVGKGMLDLFELQNNLIAEGITNFSIDLYGPICTEFEPIFLSVLADSNYIKYKRILDPTEIHGTLVNYDLMLFPTHFYTEGLPGTVLDAYLAGIPVMACSWKHASEYIVDEKTGFIYDFKNKEDLFRKVKEVLNEPHKLGAMKHNSYQKSFDYTKEFALELLIRNRLV